MCKHSLVVPELIIFDCDGVLVDSEKLAIKIDQEFLLEIGISMSLEEIVKKFVGKSDQYFQLEIERLVGLNLAPNWKSDLEDRYNQVFAKELKPVNGIIEVLESLEVPVCVASSGSQKKIRNSLELTSLSGYFGENIFSAEQVSKGKPDPELFLFAAAQMEANPAKTVVVEDSNAGVLAGVAAQMHVFGYCGSVTPKSDLLISGVTPFDQMNELLLAISAKNN
jgi:HAD superfamily hydrolase (TIGR01509 family)